MGTFRPILFEDPEVVAAGTGVSVGVPAGQVVGVEVFPLVGFQEEFEAGFSPGCLPSSTVFFFFEFV